MSITSDPFFNQKKCSRCPAKLRVRTRSWFNNDTICMDCYFKEKAIRKQLPNKGRDHECCGYVPVLNLTH